MGNDISRIRECKRCLLYEMADKAQYNSVQNYIATIPESERASEELYRKRLEVCRLCDHLISGMCRKCGCYVEVRAYIKKNSCPSENSKW